MTDPPYSSEALGDCGQSLVLPLITLTLEVWAWYLLLSLSYLQMWWLILLASSTGPWGHARADKLPDLSGSSVLNGMTHRKCGQYHPVGWGPGLDKSRAELSATVHLSLVPTLEVICQSASCSAPMTSRHEGWYSHLVSRQVAFSRYFDTAIRKVINTVSLPLTRHSF